MKFGSWKMLKAYQGRCDVYHQWGHIFLFTKNTWIGDYSALCVSHHKQQYLSFDVININESIQESSRNMLVRKKGKLCITI